MIKKNYLTLDDEFIQYCKLNNIDDVEKFAKEIFNKGFTSLKYGDKPIIGRNIVEQQFKTKLDITTPTKEEVIEKLDSLEVIKKKDIYGE
jgi:hypothetical protein